MLRGIFLCAFVLAAAMVLPVCAEQVDPADTAVMSAIGGNIVSVDWVGSKIVLDTGGDQVTFCFDDDVVVQQAGHSISVNSLQQGDSVTVHFINKKHVGLWVVSITDNQPDL